MPFEGRPFAVEPDPVLRGEEVGEGPPVVLCHGITATRRYVLHGSKALPRDGYRVVAYDARGHGESEPAPAGEGYGYPELVADLERVVDSRIEEERFLLGGHSMGAHTAVAYALRHPQRLAGLVLIGPTYTGTIEPSSLQYWDGLAAAAAYAEALPAGQLISEGPGESPLAWQGGKLSRALADFYAEALSSAP